LWKQFIAEIPIVGLDNWLLQGWAILQHLYRFDAVNPAALDSWVPNGILEGVIKIRVPMAVR